MSRIMIVVEFEVKPEHRNAFIELVKGHARLSRAEDGCQQFDVLLPQNDPGRVSCWSRRGATRRHSTCMRSGRKATRCTAD
jgi:quinol monooxygenase YgiN